MSPSTSQEDGSNEDPPQENPLGMYVFMCVFTHREGTKCPKKTILGRKLNKEKNLCVGR